MNGDIRRITPEERIEGLATAGMTREEAGATEVAVHRGFADELAEALRARRLEAYALGPPRQLELFRG